MKILRHCLILTATPGNRPGLLLTCPACGAGTGFTIHYQDAQDFTITCLCGSTYTAHDLADLGRLHAYHLKQTLEPTATPISTLPT